MARFAVALFFLLAPVFWLSAQTIKVGVVELPPLVVREATGEWRGIGVEVWVELATRLGIQYQIVAYSTHTELVEALINGEVALSIPSVPVNALAPKNIEFSQPFFSSSFAAAVAPNHWKITWANSLRAMLSVGALEFGAALIGLLAFGGLVIWTCERRRNPGEFGGSLLEGLGHGIWWSAVTMTTVGYGDKSPRTMVGRIFAILWMFVGFILLSIFVSALVSNISTQMAQGNQAVQDLRRMKVGAINESPSMDFLKARGINATGYNSIGEMLQAFRDRRIDAIFSDAAHLRHAEWRGFGYVPQIISQSGGCNWYAFALKEGNALTGTLNSALLRFIQEPRWDEIVSRESNSYYLMNERW